MICPDNCTTLIKPWQCTYWGQKSFLKLDNILTWFNGVRYALNMLNLLSPHKAKHGHMTDHWWMADNRHPVLTIAYICELWWVKKNARVNLDPVHLMKIKTIYGTKESKHGHSDHIVNKGIVTKYLTSCDQMFIMQAILIIHF